MSRIKLHTHPRYINVNKPDTVESPNLRRRPDKLSHCHSARKSDYVKSLDKIWHRIDRLSKREEAQAIIFPTMMCLFIGLNIWLLSTLLIWGP